MHHACAAIHLRNRVLLVDHAYQLFDVHHREFDILNDGDAYKILNMEVEIKIENFGHVSQKAKSS